MGNTQQAAIKLNISPVQKPLLKAMVYEIAYWFLQSGIKHSDFQELFVDGFVCAAERDLKMRGKKLSQREIYRTSGVCPEAQRKSRSKYIECTAQSLVSLSDVIHNWRFKPPYGESGKAKPLRIRAEIGKDFKSLCSDTVPYFSYKSLLVDLIDYGVVSLTNSGGVKLKKNRLIPTKADTHFFENSMKSLRAHFAACNHNSTVDAHESSETYHRHLEKFQRTVEAVPDMQGVWRVTHETLNDVMDMLETIFDSAEKPGHAESKGSIFAGVYLHIDPAVDGGME